MKNTPKTLTLSAKTVKPAASAAAQPKATLVEPLDPAQTAAPVTVVRKRSRLASPAEAESSAPVAQGNEAPAAAAGAARPAAVKKVSAKTVSKLEAARLDAAKAEADKSQPAAEPRGTAPVVSQTTDAATLAAIDTSGYVLPSVKVPGRRGRKPSEFTPENDEVAALNAVERAELKAASKAKDRKKAGRDDEGAT